MRYVIVVVLIILTSSCSWWPFGSKKDRSCLDDKSCDAASNPFEERLVGGTWYCYGVDRDEAWDCSQEEDAGKIAAIAEKKIKPIPPEETLSPVRAEMSFDEELISNQSETAVPPPESTTKQATPAVEPMTEMKSGLFSFADSSYAVQLIALQTLEEIQGFADDHDIDTPDYVRIRSQGSDWYVLILGIYDEQSEADRVAEAWTDLHQPSSKPWVRPLGPLKRAAMEAETSGS